MAKHKGKPNNQNRQRQKEAAQKFRLPEAAKSGHARERQRQEAVVHTGSGRQSAGNAKDSLARAPATD
jgi:hypothetical protein